MGRSNEWLPIPKSPSPADECAPQMSKSFFILSANAVLHSADSSDETLRDSA